MMQKLQTVHNQAQAQTTTKFKINWIKMYLPTN